MSVNSKQDIDMIHRKLTITVEKYIKTILADYGKYIPKEVIDKLNKIDFNSIIKIYDTKSINGYEGNDMIHLPICVDKIFRTMSKIPGYGINKGHKTYNEDNIIENDNTFLKYVIHVFISGTNMQEYYDDLLLHETVHLCGSDGGYALKEGLTELLTRKLAKKYGFRTNGCAYPKEVAVCLELQRIFGEDFINKITFINSMRDIKNYITDNYGEEEAILFDKVVGGMQQEFNIKYGQYLSSFKGISGIFKKTHTYNQIDYSQIYEMLEEYEKKKAVKR